MNTEHAIKLVKDTFQQELSSALHLRRVTAPLFVESGHGLNDDLTGVEKPVSFFVPALNRTCEIVHSLAKWKRMKLWRMDAQPGYGIYTDMNAIRTFETPDEIHSLYVDQWDWEKVLTPRDRTREYLRATVRDIYKVLCNVEYVVCERCPEIEPYLPHEITFITAEQLLQRYPDMSPKQREDAICREYGAVFIEGIGAPLSDGHPHDSRAADYDDWSLNGDILIWYPILGKAIELSSMGYAKGELLATISFEIVAKYVTNLKAEVAEDHKTATLTWDAPEFASGERLYVRVWSGETVAYDNFNTSDRPTSPLVINVVEGKSYTAVVQLVDRNQNPQGPEVETNFTVGVNNYEPKNPTAVVEGGDNVTFSWTADELADAYVITLYLNGEFYATLNVHETTKTTTTPADGTWSWTVQAFNIGENDKYFEASKPIAGNDFDTKSAVIPEDAIELDVIGLNAYYIEPTSEFYQEGKNGWILQFGIENTGYNYAWFLVYTSSPYAISGIYNLTRENLEHESDGIFMTSSNDPLEGTDSEVRLSFDGYEEVEVTSTYSVTKAFYTGYFRLVDTDGKTYVGRFMELECSSGGFTNYYNGASVESITLYDEDPSYFMQGIESVVAATPNGKKVLYNGQILIIRDGKAYNMLGTMVK